MAADKIKKISTFGSRFTSLISVSLVLLLLGIAMIIGVAARQMDGELRSGLGFILIMERDCPQTDINSLKSSLMASPAVESFVFMSSDEILARESEYMGEDIAALVEGNPYAAEFDVKLKTHYATPDSIGKLTALYATAHGVSEVNSEEAIIEGIDTFARRATTVLIVLALILLAISVVLINNAVSLSIYSKRFLIHTMRLVGATPGFIRRPFLRAGLINGSISGLISTALLALFNVYAPVLAAMPSPLIAWSYIIIIGVCLTVCGSLICCCTASFATGRYLRTSYDDMFLK